MGKAIGLIETRGLVCAIEAADVMLKAANVTFAGKEKTDSAMITIKITGDVEDVKTAIDAGAAAAKRVGELVSAIVIPEPDDQLYFILPDIPRNTTKDIPFKPEENIEKLKKLIREESHLTEADNNNSTENIFDKISKIKAEVDKNSTEKISSEDISGAVIKSTGSTTPNEEKKGNTPPFSNNNDTISRLRKEALGLKAEKNKYIGSKSPKPDTKTAGEEIEPSSLSEDYLVSLNVHLLRKLARSTKNFPIRGREISKANRQELLDLFKKLH
ncbi:MAG: BMC domain-containing protein [Ignavibacteriaceae bacterium]